MKKSRRQIAREQAIIGIYQHLLVDNTIEDIYGFLSENDVLLNTLGKVGTKCDLIGTLSINKWMNLKSKKVDKDTEIIVWGKVVTGSTTSYCVINFKKSSDPEPKTCTNLYKPVEYKQIKQYCENNWQNDTANYSSYDDCYISCTNSNKTATCKNTYDCKDTFSIRQYCKLKYQQDGYKTIANCINDCSCGNNGIKYYYRTISVDNPFPNREANSNWLGYEEYITNDLNDSTPSEGNSAPEYEIVLDSNRIEKIRKHTKKYNSSGKDAYGDFIRLNSDDIGSYKSKFIHEDDIEEGGFTTYFTYIEGIKTGG